MSGGESKSNAIAAVESAVEVTETIEEGFWRLTTASRGCIDDTLAFKSSLILGITSVSGVPSTDMLLRDMESSEDNVLEDKACDP